MGQTKIEWTDTVWNPITGCTPVSEGCEHCYAKAMAKRFWTGRDFGDVQVHPERIDEPLHWLKSQPRRVFVCSMSDLFHEKVPVKFQMRVFNVMGQAKEHTFQVLTKRIERMKIYLTELYRMWAKWPEDHRPQIPYPNIWLGITCENQKWLDIRAPYLLQIQAAVRFICFEPLLGEIDIFGYPKIDNYQATAFSHYGTPDWYRPKYEGLDWVIVGGESGPGARPMNPDWVRSIRDQCQAAGVPFFFKQWGGVNKKKAGRILDGRTWDEYPKGSD